MAGVPPRTHDPSVPPVRPGVRAQRSVARLLDRLPDAAKVRLSGRPPVRLDGEELDPGIQLMLRLQALQGNAALIHPGAQDVARERRRVRHDAEVAQGRRTPVGDVSELAVDGGDPARPQLRARHYAPPRDAAGAPLLVFLHGGGWVVGDLDTHDEICRLLCRHAGIHVVSVDYSLAPEHPFPAGALDAQAATAWALREAGALGADPGRVAVGGDSAGGTLSAVCAQAFATDPELRERAGGRRPALQLLIYPGADLTPRQWPSDQLFETGFFLDGVSRRWFQERYLPPGSDPSDPRISPLYGDVQGVAPAVVVTAAFDPLRDEGEAYAAALTAAEVPTVCVRMPGLIHGFISMTGVSGTARDAVMRLTGILRAELTAPREAAARV